MGPGKLYSASTLESYQKGKTFELPVHECTASYLHNRSALLAGLPEAVPAEPALCCHVPGCLYYWLQKHINKNRRTFKSRSLAESAKQVIKKIFTKEEAALAPAPSHNPADIAPMKTKKTQSPLQEKARTQQFSHFCSCSLSLSLAKLTPNK